MSFGTTSFSAASNTNMGVCPEAHVSADRSREYAFARNIETESPLRYAGSIDLHPSQRVNLYHCRKACKHCLSRLAVVSASRQILKFDRLAMRRVAIGIGPGVLTFPQGGRIRQAFRDDQTFERR